MQCEPAERKLRIGFVFSRLPFPMMRGDQLTVAHLLGFLAARGHQIDFRTLDQHGAIAPAQQAWLERICRKMVVFPQSRFDNIAGMAHAALSGLPVQLGFFRNRALERDLASDVAAGEYDIVYAYYLRSAPPTASAMRNAPPTTRSFLAMQLSQTLNARRIFERETNLLKKLFYRFESRRLARFESRIWQKFDRVVLIGPADVAAITAECDRFGSRKIDNWVYGAHGTDVDHFIPATAADIVKDRYVFSGSMLYQPNIQAITWFVEHCWPAIRRAIPAAQLVIQGRDPVREIRRLDGVNGIEVTGTVPDVGPVIRSAAVCINPMLAAGGMQNKLIEYMASAKAVVASTIANEGIGAPADTVRLADDPDSFARACIELSRQPDEAFAMGQRARAHVLRHWTWESHFLKLEADFYDALDSAQARR
jgi:glycosyltransferase involved in cell wall biosynthesis